MNVIPEWFPEFEPQRFLWSEPYWPDRQLVISRKETAFEYAGPQSLDGLRIGGVAGYRYRGIDPRVERGELKRTDSAGIPQLMQALKTKHIDVAFVSEANYRYWQKRDSIVSHFHEAQQVHSSYSRQLLVSRNDPELQHWLNAVLANRDQDVEWQTLVQRYRTDPIAP